MTEIPPQLDEASLLARAQAGDEAAFAALFERHEGAIAGKVRAGMPRALDRRFSVADVVQDVRIVACDKIRDFEVQGEDALRRWLLRIAEYRLGSALKKHLKARKRAVAAEVSRGRRPDTHAFHAEGPSPSRLVAARESRQRVRDALSLLREDDRRVLTLVFEQQLTLREVGERMGRSREAAKKLYGRALERFTEVLEAQGGVSDA